MNKVMWIILVSVLSACSFSSQTIQEPKRSKGDNYIKHFAYSLVYNQETKQADWVAYQLNNYQTENNYSRTNKFIEDTLVENGTASNSDYYKSGYDKGHLVPASDMAWNKKAMYESFYLSNISPQLAGFNRGIWKKLEMQVRGWAQEYDNVYICTGPIFKVYNNSIGNNEVKIPTHFYKTILVYNDTIKQAIGFIFPHQKTKNSTFNYAVTVDSVEQLTGLNLYKALPNRHERKIEKALDISNWQ